MDLGGKNQIPSHAAIVVLLSGERRAVGGERAHDALWGNDNSE